MKEGIEKELKLSKKQNKNDRYNYLCSQFNGIEYAMKLEKYTNKLQQENKNLRTTIKNDDVAVNNLCKEIEILKQQLKDKNEKISEVKELLKNPSTIDYEMYGLEYSRDIVDIKLLLEILESNKED